MQFWWAKKKVGSETLQKYQTWCDTYAGEYKLFPSDALRHEKYLRHLRSIRLFDLVEKTLEDLFVPANTKNVVRLKVCEVVCSFSPNSDVTRRTDFISFELIYYPSRNFEKQIIYTPIISATHSSHKLNK